MAGLIPVSGVCLVLIVLSVVSDPGQDQTDRGGAGGDQSDSMLTVSGLIGHNIHLTDCCAAQLLHTQLQLN